MKVLWTVNMVFPDVAEKLNMKTSVSGGWLLDLARGISINKDIKLATMTYYSGKEFKIVELNGITHYLFPGGGKRLLINSKKTKKNCEFVINDFKPDLIHLQGTEYAHSYYMSQIKNNIPKILTIQGILGRISQEYYGGLSKRDFLKVFSFKHFIKLKTPFFYKKLYEKNAQRELKILNSVSYVTGRTDWDKSYMLGINNNLKYFRSNYNLRSAFYEATKWNYDKIERYSIYTGASGYSLKGLHILLKAVKILKKDYPQVKLYIPGGKITNNNKLISTNLYHDYILKLIKDLDISNNVIFLGNLNADGVVEQLQKANVCVVPSALEGASATICEGMMIGVPTISSYRGGMTELITDGVNGFTYDFIEHSFLAHKISTIFENKNLSLEFSKKNILLAESRHDREKNINNLINIYKQIA